MKKKKIVIGSLLIVFLLLMLPSVSAMQSNKAEETRKSYPFEKINIPPYIWFAIFILILAIANRLMNPEIWRVVTKGRFGEKITMEKTGLSIGIIGGVGLGLMLGSEFSGRYITILGAVLVIISLVAMGVLFYKGKK